MSAGYASRLKEYPNKGECGLPEMPDTKRVLLRKLDELVTLIRAARGNIVVLTGAGISTGAGIPDFRGPQGIWTQEQENNNNGGPRRRRRRGSKKRPRAESDASATTAEAPEAGTMDFGAAKPTLTHRALTYLVNHPKLIRYVVTQNVDGLHRRSGLSRRHHCALHGCVFTEHCRDCQAEYFRDQDVGGMSFQPTGNTCGVCGTGTLCDTLLDWEDPLPEADFERATELCEKADLVLALGTSLRIEPAGSLPTLARNFAIVNLQVTPKDEQATLILRARVDQVMAAVMERLGYNDWDEKSNEVEVERIWKPPNEETETSVSPGV